MLLSHLRLFVPQLKLVDSHGSFDLGLARLGDAHVQCPTDISELRENSSREQQHVVPTVCEATDEDLRRSTISLALVDHCSTNSFALVESGVNAFVPC